MNSNHRNELSHDVVDFLLVDGVKVKLSGLSSSGDTRQSHDAHPARCAAHDDAGLDSREKGGDNCKSSALSSSSSINVTMTSAGGLYFCSLCDLQFTDSSAALAHKATKKHRRRAGLKASSTTLVTLGLDGKPDADITVEDLKCLIEHKQREKNLRPFSEIRVKARCDGDNEGNGGSAAPTTRNCAILPEKRSRDEREML
jgi:hypothetical protein